jgi:uncharacterized protein
MELTTESPHEPLRIWALTGARAGDNDQVIALAEAIGLPFEIRKLEFNALCNLGPRLLGRSLASLTGSSRAALFVDEPPDLTISTGHRSVPAVQALRHRSGGRMRSIHVGFPRISPAKFDLVITTPQYPIAGHPNLLRIPYALTRAAIAEADASDRGGLASLPHPVQLLIVGGPTLFWEIDQQALLETLTHMLAEAARQGGSLVVTTSPRTPKALQRQIADKLEASDVPTFLVPPGSAPAYSSLLDIADSIRVTADSVSMISDAIWTGKPLGIVPVANSAAGAMYMSLMSRLRPGRPVYPQDLRLFWNALERIGVTEELNKPRTSRDGEMQRILQRVRSLLNGSNRGKNGGRGKD